MMMTTKRDVMSDATRWVGCDSDGMGNGLKKINSRRSLKI